MFINGFASALDDMGLASESYLPKVAPSADGSVTLYWDTGEAYATLDFDGGHEFAWYVRSPRQPHSEGSAKIEGGREPPLDLLRLLLRRIFGATD